MPKVACVAERLRRACVSERLRRACVAPAQLRLQRVIFSELRLFITSRVDMNLSIILFAGKNSSTSDGVKEVPAAVMGESTGAAVSPGFSRQRRENHHMASVVLRARSRHLASS